MKHQLRKHQPTKADYRGLVQIRGKVQCILGNDAYYRLYEVRRAGIRSYAINVSYGKDNVYCMLGYGRAAACGIFEKVVEGFVTPATLRDVLADWENERRGAV